MPLRPVGLVRRLWFKWRSLKLPWRRRWLAGADLSGNTFWEFKDSLGANRLRRIAKSYNPQIPYADIKISPQWHQWLRHTRFEPPSIHEQQSDLRRQVELKQLARLADERWAAKPSYLDPPKESSQVDSGTIPRDKGGYVGRTEPVENEGVRNQVGDLNDMGASEHGKEKTNPWKVDRGSPGEEWQPTSWAPGGPSKQ